MGFTVRHEPAAVRGVFAQRQGRTSDRGAGIEQAVLAGDSAGAGSKSLAPGDPAGPGHAPNVSADRCAHRSVRRCWTAQEALSGGAPACADYAAPADAALSQAKPSG